MSGYAKALVRYIEMSKSPWGVGAATRADMRFMARLIISGDYCKPFKGVW
jgi:hypothetical protein